MPVAPEDHWMGRSPTCTGYGRIGADQSRRQRSRHIAEAVPGGLNPAGAAQAALLDMSSRPPLDPVALADYCRVHGIRRLALFGSRLKGTARRDSDVDLLVEFEPWARPSLLDMAQMEIDLSEMLDGLTVDLRTKEELSRYFRDEVIRSAELLHAA